MGRRGRGGDNPMLGGGGEEGITLCGEEGENSMWGWREG